MSNRDWSAPPVIVKVAGLVPTVSASVEVKAATSVVFSATDCAASVVITGVLSFTSVTVTATACVTVCTPSNTCTVTS